MWPHERTAGTLGAPIFSMCCSKGQVSLPDIEPVPAIVDLFTGTSTRHTRFRLNSRKYNSSLAFTSCGINADPEHANMTRGVYTIRIQGSVHHFRGSLFPEEGQAPRFAQIYIYDDADQVARRMCIFNDQLDPQFLRVLQDALASVNPFVGLYRSVRERIRAPLTDTDDVRIVFRAERTTRTSRQYALPTASEVAVLLPDHADQPDAGRDIIVEGRDGRLKRMNELHWAYDPLHYVLLFPRGEKGWSPRAVRLIRNGHAVDADNAGADDVSDADSDREENDQPGRPTRRPFVSARQFYAYRLQVRPFDGTISVLHSCGRLFHQYIVDMYAKVEGFRLTFFRTNQTTIRADLYQGVMDAAAADVGLTARDIGTRIILPATFTGGPRYMQKVCQDAMAIVRTHGKPDLFITFTCNPKWPEITAALQPQQTAADRPDLCARVFKLKLDVLLNDLTVKNVLGRVIGSVYVVEFQKRGLPHAHILLILAPEDRPRTTADIDAIVSAEIPDPVLHPAAYATVTTSMVHGPCSVQARSQCIEKEKCTKKYPRRFSEETQMAEDGYPVYRRSDNGRTFTRPSDGAVIDNRWIVPHNLWLCTKYNAHINVEVCSSILAVKYLFKYVYKGHDRARVALRGDGADEVNEIREFVDARYVSATECCWRLFDMRLHRQYPKTIRLAVHLEDRQTVYYRATDSLEGVMQRNHDSTLMAWFKLNTATTEARQLKYAEVPRHYTWDIPRRKWKRRVRPSAIISRLYFVHPRDIERFSLRLLLLHRAGATSFQDLRTIDGTAHPTFRDAALACGLLDTDREWSDCLQEAATWQSPNQLRKLFVVILFACNPSNPADLWTRFAADLSHDFAFRAQQNSVATDSDLVEHANLSALHTISQLLIERGSSLDAFPGLPSLPTDFEPIPLDVDDNAQNLNDLRELATRNTTLRNPSQQRAFDTITAAIDSGTTGSRLFFVDGPGGTGKSFVFNTIIAHVKAVLHKDVLAVASSGVASLLLIGGRTAHSTFNIPIPILHDSTCSIRVQSPMASTIRNTALLIWDEAAMAHRHVFEAVDRCFREIFGRRTVWR